MDRLRRGVALLLCALMLAPLGALTGCAGEEPPAEETPEPKVCSVRLFTPEGETTRSVPQGGRFRLEAPEPIDGYRFLCWLDEQGRTETAEEITVYTDRSFAASYAVALISDSHPAYMSTDNYGRALPDKPMTRRETARMLYSLLAAPVKSRRRFIDVPRSDPCYTAAAALKELRVVGGSRFYPDDTVTLGELVEMLAAFYPPCTEEPSFTRIDSGDARYGAFCLAASNGWLDGEEPYDADPDHLMTRADTARIVNRVLGRSGAAMSEKKLGVFPDIAKGSACYADMAEALIGHNCTVEGGKELWTDYAPVKTLTDGLCLLDTELYYVKNGRFVCGEEREGFSFGPDGRYTTGSETLDELLQSALAETIGGKSLDTEEQLHVLYDYVVRFQYRKGPSWKFGDTSGAAAAAEDMLRDRRGNCYSYAAAFYELARAIGVNARIYSGTILALNGSGSTPHGWVEIELDGENYIFDTEMEAASIAARNPKSFFKVDRERAQRFRYRRKAD